MLFWIIASVESRSSDVLRICSIDYGWRESQVGRAEVVGYVLGISRQGLRMHGSGATRPQGLVTSVTGRTTAVCTVHGNASPPQESAGQAPRLNNAVPDATHSESVPARRDCAVGGTQRLCGAYKFPRRSCSCSKLSNSALKLPLPKL